MTDEDEKKPEQDITEEEAEQRDKILSEHRKKLISVQEKLITVLADGNLTSAEIVGLLEKIKIDILRPKMAEIDLKQLVQTSQKQLAETPKPEGAA